MKFWQKILNSITFGLYNPEKKFEQEVLGEATTNLEEIENLRTDVEKAANEYDKYFPNKENRYNYYSKYDSKHIDKESVLGKGEIITGYDKNQTVGNLIKSEEKLQEQGKYVGMDEATRAKAILAEGYAAQYEWYLKCELQEDFLDRDKDILEAERICAYQEYMSDDIPKTGINKFMNNKGLAEYRSSAVSDYSNDGRFDAAKQTKKYLYTLTNEPEQIYNYSNYFGDWEQSDCTEGYIALIMANDRATRQNDRTHSTKTAEEWAKIDEKREKELRDMPKEELFAQGQALEESLQARYAELTASKEGNER